MNWKQLAVVVTTSFMFGCSQMPIDDSSNQQDNVDQFVDWKEAVDVSAVSEYENNLQPALKILFDQADDAFYQQNYPLAVSRLERAQRIEPRNPSVYYRLSVIRLKQNQPKEAEQLAYKSLALSQRYPDFQSNVWKLIAASRAQRGDFEGEQGALRKSTQF